MHNLHRFDRVAGADYKLGDYQVLKDTLINIPVYAIHHDPTVYPDPEKFMPERYVSIYEWIDNEL